MALRKFTGHTVEVSLFLSLLIDEKKAEFQELLDEGDVDQIWEFLKFELYHQGLPTLDGVFLLGENGISDTLEQGSMYAVFPEKSLWKVYEDLEKRQETLFIRLLKARGIEPRESAWEISEG